jgi:hypothetical protein
MSKFITLEVPDNFDFAKKFSSDQISFCGDPNCGYYTIVNNKTGLRLMVDHLFYDPRHNGMPRRKEELETSYQR